MRLASFVTNGSPRVGIVDGDQIKPLSVHGEPISMRQLLARGDLGGAKGLMDGSSLALEGVTFAPVVPDPHAIWCAALTFDTHVKEAPGRSAPDYPLFFLRVAESQVAHRQALVRPAVSDLLDYEGELAVVIGRNARHVSVDDALTYVAGYSCYNEGSVRDWQRHSPQITPGKNFAATGGFGPWLVTPDEFGDPYSRRITTRVNGAVRQQECIDALLFRIEYFVHYLSAIHTLLPGDVIVCGTPGGVGMRRDPPVFLDEGDVVTVEIDGIGTLENAVVREQPDGVAWQAKTPTEATA